MKRKQEVLRLGFNDAGRKQMYQEVKIGMWFLSAFIFLCAGIFIIPLIPSAYCFYKGYKEYKKYKNE